MREELQRQINQLRQQQQQQAAVSDRSIAEQTQTGPTAAADTEVGTGTLQYIVVYIILY